MVEVVAVVTSIGQVEGAPREWSQEGAVLLAVQHCLQQGSGRISPEGAAQLSISSSRRRGSWS